MFHEVTGLRIAVDWRREGSYELIHPLSISQIVRRPIEPPTPQGGQAYDWRVESNWPDNRSISFGATSFTLKLRADPVETDGRQHLSTQQRRHL